MQYVWKCQCTMQNKRTPPQFPAKKKKKKTSLCGDLCSCVFAFARVCACACAQIREGKRKRFRGKWINGRIQQRHSKQPSHSPDRGGTIGMYVRGREKPTIEADTKRRKRNRERKWGSKRCPYQYFSCISNASQLHTCMQKVRLLVWLLPKTICLNFYLNFASRRVIKNECAVELMNRLFARVV